MKIKHRNPFGDITNRQENHTTARDDNSRCAIQVPECANFPRPRQEHPGGSVGHVIAVKPSSLQTLCDVHTEDSSSCSPESDHDQRELPSIQHDVDEHNDSSWETFFRVMFAYNVLTNCPCSALEFL